ncbi:hypothetical protein NMG46_21955 [Mesorhizobium sp. LMG 17147]|uniref:hypothetical protein n=1 Tax=Mesorhizobium sp. LMG 17147 TaxID=2963091 RepID=UPI0020C99C73|nr:hypothetical protein [Mesorhizobium sp. LMG 17147]MCP9232879.1 hypothetical protein [Mesorhizobium sp. LMG 17147]
MSTNLAAGKGNRIFLPVRHILFLLCAGSYATNLGMVLIGSNDPPAEAGFLFRLYLSIE